MSPPVLLHAAEPTLTYRLMRWMLLPVFRLILRGQTEGTANVPPHGGVVVVANHGSYIDPPILSCAVRRPVAFMAKEELFRVPLLGSLIRACGAYPVARGAGDRQALRNAYNRLQQGWATGVFLDGTRQADGRVSRPQPGAAFLAARAGLPILPVAIINSHRALGPGGGGLRLVPVHVRIGTPIPPPASTRRADLDAATAAAQAQINRMLDLGLIRRPQLGGASPPALISPRSSDPDR
ncbi:MAG: lysophospholipid acyltransferase family protein [Cyanobacteriota bacterium]